MAGRHRGSGVKKYEHARPLSIGIEFMDITVSETVNERRREAVRKQIEARANAIQGHTNENLLTESSAKAIVAPLLAALEYKDEIIKDLREDLDSLRRQDTDN